MSDVVDVLDKERARLVWKTEWTGLEDGYPRVQWICYGRTAETAAKTYVGGYRAPDFWIVLILVLGSSRGPYCSIVGPEGWSVEAGPSVGPGRRRESEVVTGHTVPCPMQPAAAGQELEMSDAKAQLER